MHRRLTLLFFLLAAFSPASHCASTVSVRIHRFGLEGIFNSSGPTWVQVEVSNISSETLSFDLAVTEANLDSGALPMTEVCTRPLTLAPSELRLVDIPLYVLPQTQYNHAVIFAQALDARGLPLGMAGRRVGQVAEGQVIALLCATPDICRAIRQSILLTGTPEEQTKKSQTLRLIQLPEALPLSWAYSAANTVVVADSAAHLSQPQREALDIYLHRGGRLVLIEGLLNDGQDGSERQRFLGVYRNPAPEGKVLFVGEGQLARFKSASSQDFSNYFRLSASIDRAPELLQFARLAREIQGETRQLNSWLMKRLGTSFRFPSFLELLLWILGYLLLVGVVNFLALRRIGRPEWGWVTIPGIAVLFSILLFAVSARKHPSNFGLDEMTVYRMDNLDPLATSDSKFRVSSPVRSSVHPILPGDLVYVSRQPFQFSLGDAFIIDRKQAAFSRKFQLGQTWETTMQLRRWSFEDMDFEGQQRFPGTVYRDSLGRLHNETGIDYQQAIAVDHEDVFLLGKFPAGAIVDLARVTRHSYSQETGRSLSNPAYPGPPFSFHRSESNGSVSEEEERRHREEFTALSSQPFSLLELIRGWPRKGEDVFSETRAVFFGLSEQATHGALLRDRSPDRKAFSLTIVTFGEWP